MDRLIAWLPAAIPDAGDRTTIIHGDYSFHNLLIHPTEPRVAAVIDWELSTLGDPLGDLTYHMMEWFRPEGVDVRGTLRGADLAALGIPSAEDYARAYRDRTGFAVDPTHPVLHRLQPVPGRGDPSGHRRPRAGRRADRRQFRRDHPADRSAGSRRLAIGAGSRSELNPRTCTERVQKRTYDGERASECPEVSV